MLALNHKEGWAPKNWCFQTLVLKKTLESPLDCKEIKPVNPKGNQYWIFIGRTDAEAGVPILWPPNAKSWLTGKDPDAGKEWRQKEKGTKEDEMAGWHYWHSRHEFEQTAGDGEGQGSLAHCSLSGCKVWTWLSNWTKKPSLYWLLSRSHGCINARKYQLVCYKDSIFRVWQKLFIIFNFQGKNFKPQWQYF